MQQIVEVALILSSRRNKTDVLPHGEVDFSIHVGTGPDAGVSAVDQVAVLGLAATANKMLVPLFGSPLTVGQIEIKGLGLNDACERNPVLYEWHSKVLAVYNFPEAP